jgi:U3 small nucleolar RNA-associated protein 22
MHRFIMSIPSVAPQHPLDSARTLIKKGVSVPYALPLPTQDALWKVSFEKPDSITLVGSWANKVSVKGKDGAKFGVDLAVEMPQVTLFLIQIVSCKQFLAGRAYSKKKTIWMVGSFTSEPFTWLF